jgi:type II secretory pathway predicted ATPase ExeA
MYQAYWGLASSPFRGHLDPRAFHQGPTQEEALARLHFLVDEQRTVGLLLGEAGSGKSLLLEVFAQQLGAARRERAVVSLLGTSRQEFLWLLAGQLGIEGLHSSSNLQLHRAIDDHILANRYQQISTVLLLDDADEATSDVLNEVVRLAQLNQAQQARLTMVLSARPHRLARLGSRLLELAELRVDLEGWDADDTAAFVKESLAAAGRSTPIFSENALRRLHELAEGIPRRIKQLADLALIGGAGSNLAQIEPDLIETVYHELGVECVRAPLSLH